MLNISSTTIKKAAFLPVLCLSFLCFSQSATISSTGEEENGKVEFVKSENGNIYFEVGLKNIPAKGCMLRITNQSNELIYESKISAHSYAKTFKLPYNDLTKVNFDISGKKYQVYRSFDLKYKVETKLEVSRL